MVAHRSCTLTLSSIRLMHSGPVLSIAVPTFDTPCSQFIHTSELEFMMDPVRSKYSNVLKFWVMTLPAPNGLGKTLRANSGPCNVV